MSEGIPAELQQAVEAEAGTIQLDEVIATLQQAQRSKNAREALDAIKKAVSGLSKADFDLISGQDEFVNLLNDLERRVDKTKKPGSPVYDAGGRQIGKTPYTMKDLENMFPMVEWTPTKTTHIGYNGVTIFVRAHEKIKSPACFRDIFEDSERETARAYAQAESVLRQGPADQVALSVGWTKATDEELEKRYGRES